MKLTETSQIRKEKKKLIQSTQKLFEVKKRKKKSSKQIKEKKLEKLVKDFVKKRDYNICQKCGVLCSGANCHASHVIPVSFSKRMAFISENLKVLCYHCHINWWHKNPTESGEWFKKKFPKRMKFLEKMKFEVKKQGTIFESDIEQLVIEFLEQQGYVYLSPEEQEAERSSLSEVVLRNRLKTAINKLNPTIPENAKEQALREVLNLSSQSLIENNEAFHRMLTDGVNVEYQKNGGTVGDKVWLIDFENPLNNNFLVCNQFTVVENNVTKRPDVVILVNGLPLVVIELKNPADENATVKKAFTQLQNYKKAISSLFCYNGVLVASDGLDAKMGSLTADWSRFMAWKTVDGLKEEKSTTPQIETLIKHNIIE